MNGYAKINPTQKQRDSALKYHNAITHEYNLFDKSKFKKTIFGFSYGFDKEKANDSLKYCFVGIFLGAVSISKRNRFYMLEELIVLLTKDEVYLDSEAVSLLILAEGFE